MAFGGIGVFLLGMRLFANRLLALDVAQTPEA